jgi:hypothetical protein
VGQVPPVLPGVRLSAWHRSPMASYETMNLKKEINRH